MMKVEIREWRESDAPKLAALLNNKKILNNLRDGLPYPYTEGDARAFIAAMASADRKATFAFAVLCDGELAGSVGIFRQGNIHFRTAELGYYIGENFWGRGIATEAVKLACGAVFADTDILRIYAEPFADNLASCRVLEKSGFSAEGVLRKNAVKNGVVRDMKLYALLKE